MKVLCKRNNTVDVWGTYQFDDPNDLFEREPFGILISSKETEDTETGLTLSISSSRAMSLCVSTPNKTPTDPWKFFLLGAHLKPTNVCSELGALGNAYRNTSQAFNDSSGIVLGDLNADCRYNTKIQAKVAAEYLFIYRYLNGCPFQDLEIVQRPFTKWLIDFSIDTTTTPNYCAYDR